MAEIILPGTYIKVFDEGLISAGAVASGNIGIVGTANKGPVAEVQIISSFSEAREIFGDADAWDAKSDNLTLTRSLELIFNNGGRTVYAIRAAAPAASKAKVTLKKGSENIVTAEALTAGTHGNTIEVEVVKGEDGEDDQFIVNDGQTAEKYALTANSDVINFKALQATVNDRSQLIRITATKNVKTDAIPATALTGGANGEKVTTAELKNGLQLLENDIINIVVLAGQDTSNASLLAAHIKRTAENKRERIAVIGKECRCRPRQRNQPPGKQRPPDCSRPRHKNQKCKPTNP